MSLIIEPGAAGRCRAPKRVVVLFLLACATMVNSGYSEQSRGGIFSLGISDDATVRFEWKANAEADLAGYKLYIGTVPGVYATGMDVGRRTSFEVTGLIRGMIYYFSLTAYNEAGLESDFTPELTCQIPLQPIGGQAPQVLHEEAIDSPPAISSIPDQALSKNRVSDPIPFVVGVAETAAADLQLVVYSSNPVVVPASGVTVAGSGGDSLLLIDPANGETGTSLITVVVTDGSSMATVSFLVTVGQADE